MQEKEDIDRKKKEDFISDYCQCRDRLMLPGIILCILICLVIYFIKLINDVNFNIFLLLAVILYLITFSKILCLVLNNCYQLSKKIEIFENRLHDLEKLKK